MLRIHRRRLRYYGMKLYFVKNTKATAVLFESFFVDNAKDKQIGDTIPEQKAFGVAYAKAILEYYGIAYKGTAATAPKAEAKPAKVEASNESADPGYRVRVTADVLNVRAGAGIQHKINTTIRKDEVYTIVAESGGWGCLKSGAGWISLKYTEKA